MDGWLHPGSLIFPESDLPVGKAFRMHRDDAVLLGWLKEKVDVKMLRLAIRFGRNWHVFPILIKDFLNLVISWYLPHSIFRKLFSRFHKILPGLFWFTCRNLVVPAFGCLPPCVFMKNSFVWGCSSNRTRLKHFENPKSHPTKNWHKCHSEKKQQTLPDYHLINYPQISIKNALQSIQGGCCKHLSNGKNPGCWGYIGGYTTQFYRDYNKPL